MQEATGAIKKVTIEKINLGMVHQRRYHVRYTSGVERVYNTPPETVEKFIKENRRDMTKVSYSFKDRSDIK